MTKTNSKKALLSSAFALVLSIAMLIGTTFAWFTDTASTAVNKIQSGNLDVALEMKEGDSWVSAEKKTLKFVKAKGAEKEEILWEPGATYALPELRVVNKGNLALKYKIAITGIDGDSKLCEVIDWYYNDTEISKATSMAVSEDVVLNAKTEGAAFTLKGHMQETAGNDYQGLSISGIAITVYATQATVESDSFNNQYDKDAEYAFVTTAEELEAAIAAGKNVILNSNLSLDKNLTITKDSTIIGNGHAIISNKPLSIAPDANVTIQNVTFASPTNSKDNASNLYARYLKGKLVLDGCSFKGTQWDCVQVIPMPGSEIVINNCRFEAESAAQRFIHIQAADNSNADVKVTLTNNFFGSTKNLSNSMIDLDYINLDGIDFGGNNVYTDEGNGIYVCGASLSATISSAEAFKRLGSKLVSAGDQTEVNDAITNAGDKKTTIAIPANKTITLDNGIANEGTKSRDITFTGDGSQTVDVVTNAVGAEGGQLNYQRGSSFTFENLTIQAGEGSFDGIVCDELTYKDCTIKGKLTLYGKATFINCTFENNMADQYSIWTWGGTDVKVEGCTFNTNGKAILLYGQATESKPTNLVVTDCTFNDRNNGAAGKAAIEIGNDYNATYTLTVKNAAVNGFADGKNTGSKLWANKNSMDAAHLTVTIDGKKVQ